MGKVLSGFTKNSFFSFIVLIILNLIYAEPHSDSVDLSSLDFAQIKRDLFLQNGYYFSSIIGEFDNNTKDYRTMCSNEMKKIQSDLQSSLNWASKGESQFLKNSFWKKMCVFCVQFSIHGEIYHSPFQVRIRMTLAIFHNVSILSGMENSSNRNIVWDSLSLSSMMIKWQIFQIRFAKE